MALRFASQVRTAGPSTQQVTNRALDNLTKTASVASPVEELGTSTHDPNQAERVQQAAQRAQQTTQAAEDAASAAQEAAKPPGSTLSQLSSIRRTPTQPVADTSELNQRPAISSKVSTSPASADVLRSSIPTTAGTADNVVVKTDAEKRDTYNQELDKQRLPSYQQGIKPNLEVLEQDSVFQEMGDFDFDSDLTDFTMDEDVQRTEMGFLENSKLLGDKFKAKATENPRVNEVLTKSGIIEQNGALNTDAVGALLFSVGLEKKLNDRGNDNEVSRLNEAVTSGVVNQESLSGTNLYNVLTTPLDRQQLQSNLFSRFSQVYKGLDDVNDPSQKPGTFTNRDRLASPMTKADESLFAVSTLDMLEDMGMIRAVKRKDPDNSNKDRIGYEVTDKFDKVYGGVTELIGQYSDKLVVDVSLSPLVNGVPVGHAAAQHKQLTKAEPSVRLGKGDPAIVAMDIAGKTAWAVQDDTYTGNVMYLSEVMKSNKHPIFGFFDSPFASFFLMDSKTFLKHIPNINKLDESYKAEVDQYNAAPSFFKKPYRGEYTKKSWNNITELQDTYLKLKRDSELGDQQATLDFNDLHTRVVMPARFVQKSVAGGYTQDIMDAARLKGETIYYPQRAQAGTTRIQVGTTTLNYQNSKKARGLVGNTIQYPVRARSLSDILSGKAQTNKKQLILEAMIARNFEEAGSLLSDVTNTLDSKGNKIKPSRSKDIKMQADALRNALNSNPDIVRVAKFVANSTDGMKNSANEWGIAAQEFVRDRSNNQQSFKPMDASSYFPKVELNFDPIQNKNEMELLAEMMGLVDSDGNPQGKSDHADFVYKSLQTLGDYLNKGESNGIISTNLTAEIDGIASGLTIQGYQFGDENYLKHGGVLYDGSLTTPFGDMRDLIQATIAKPGGVVDSMGFDDAKTRAMKDMYLTIKSEGMSKALHKTAAMTVAYAQEAKSAAKESVNKFKNDIVGTKLQEYIQGYANDIFTGDNIGTKYEQIIQEMIDIEAKAIVQALGPSTQMAEAVGQAGLLAGIVNEPYVYKLTNGHEMYLSGVKYVDATGSPNAGEVYRDSSGVDRFITTKEAVSNPAQRSEDYGNGLREAGSKISKTASVLPTQGIDAEIAQRTLINVHQKLKPITPGPRSEADDFAWVGQVFDAFIVDLGSYEVTRKAANDQFLAVNRESNQARQHGDAVRLLMQKMEAKVREYHKNGNKFAVRPGGEYEAAFEAFRDLSKRVKRILNSDQLSNLNTSNKELLKKFESYFSGKLKFDPQRGNDMTPQEFQAAVKAYVAATNLQGLLAKLESIHNQGRKVIDEKLRTQGGPVLQYG